MCAIKIIQNRYGHVSCIWCQLCSLRRWYKSCKSSCQHPYLIYFIPPPPAGPAVISPFSSDYMMKCQRNGRQRLVSGTHGCSEDFVRSRCFHQRYAEESSTIVLCLLHHNHWIGCLCLVCTLTFQFLFSLWYFPSHFTPYSLIQCNKWTTQAGDEKDTADVILSLVLSLWDDTLHPTY